MAISAVCWRTRGLQEFFDTFLAAYSNSRIRHEGFKLVCFGGGTFRPEEREAIRAYGLQETDVIQTGGGDDLLAPIMLMHRCLCIHRFMKASVSTVGSHADELPDCL